MKNNYCILNYYNIFKSIIKEKYKPKIDYTISTEERKKNLMNLKSKLSYFIN